MPKGIYKGFILLLFAIFLVGCTSAKQIQVRSYQQDKKRVDQDLGGALGNWENSSKVATDEERKKTRKVYVVEFTQAPEEAPYNVDEVEVNTSRYTAESDSYEVKTTTTRKRIQSIPKIDLPSFDEDEEWIGQDDGPRKAETFVEYKVQKEDTMQKISKKFYGSYSKWPRIYDANKQKIKDPNFIKPGIVILVPVD